MVLTSEHEYSSRWAVLVSVAAKTGCTPDALRTWVNKIEVDSWQKPSVTIDTVTKIKALEQEEQLQKQASERLQKSANTASSAEQSQEFEPE